jgi:hypothetical protein
MLNAFILAVTDALPDITSLGAAGLIGGMWLWERRSSLTREQMLEDAHTRIIADKVQLDALVDIVKQNTEALTLLTARLDTGGIIQREKP